jgi:hypothetical protein
LVLFNSLIHREFSDIIVKILLYSCAIHIILNIYIYHIFCCNMFVFACPIIAKSQCWLFDLSMCPDMSVFVLEQITKINLLREFPLFNLQYFCFESGFKNIPNNVDLYNDVRDCLWNLPKTLTFEWKFLFDTTYTSWYVRICPRIQLPVFVQWSQSCQSTRKDMHKIVFQ